MKPIGMHHLGSLVRRPRGGKQMAIHDRVVFVDLGGRNKYFPRGTTVAAAVGRVGKEKARGTGWVMRADRNLMGVGLGSTVTDYFAKADAAAVRRAKHDIRTATKSVRGATESRKLKIQGPIN